MYCSPFYYDKEGNKKNKERLEGDSTCNDKCFFFEDCKKETGMPKDWTTTKWIEIRATNEDIISGKYHVKDGKSVKWVRYK